MFAGPYLVRGTRGNCPSRDNLRVQNWEFLLTNKFKKRIKKLFLSIQDLIKKGLKLILLSVYSVVYFDQPMGAYPHHRSLVKIIFFSILTSFLSQMETQC